MKTKKDKLKLLKETVKYYSKNTKRRCLQDGVCFYNGQRNYRTKSKGCAIGRLLDTETAEMIDKNYSFEGIPSGVDDIFTLLPENIQDYGIDFLTELQNLHDSALHWDESGLTNTGRRKVEIIENAINSEEI